MARRNGFGLGGDRDHRLPERNQIADHQRLQLGVMVVLGVEQLQFQEAQRQRAHQAEQRGRKRGAHAAQRRRQPILELGDQGHGIGGLLGGQAADHVAYPSNRQQQAVERADQTEQHQRPDQIAHQRPLVLAARRQRIQQVGQGRSRVAMPDDPVNLVQKIAHPASAAIAQQGIVGLRKRQFTAAGLQRYHGGLIRRADIEQRAG